MKRLLTVSLFSSLLLIQCGGEGRAPTGGGQAFAGEGTREGEGTTENLPKIKNEAIPGAGGLVAVDAGFASNGTKISIPTGFIAKTQCKMTAAAANIQGNAISTTVGINSETGEVICKKVVQEREEVAPETKDCVASYTVICVKETKTP